MVGDTKIIVRGDDIASGIGVRGLIFNVSLG